MVLSSWCEYEPSKSSVQLQDRSYQVPSSRIRDRELREETSYWIRSYNVIYLSICTNYLYERTIHEFELHWLVVSSLEYFLWNVVKHCLPIVVYVVPECFPSLFVLGEYIIINTLSFKGFLYECLECCFVFSRPSMPNEDSTLECIKSFQCFSLIWSSCEVVRECYLHRFKRPI